MRMLGVETMPEKIKTKTISQRVHFECSPKEVYSALMDSKKHSQFTGGKAVISQKVGGTFSAYDGYAFGKNVELVKDTKIVQTWRASDWSTGCESLVTFSMKKSPSGGTMLAFKQENVPVSCAKDIEKGWKDYYWKPMKEMLEKEK